ncbi:hypothetical protein ACSSS7_004788 [Eimeria intestinalis]
MAASAAAAAAQQLLLLLLLAACCCCLLQNPAAAAVVHPKSSSNSNSNSNSNSSNSSSSSSKSSSSNTTENVAEDDDEQIRQLFAAFLGAPPAAELWLNVRRFPGGGVPPVEQQEHQQEHQQERQEQQQQQQDQQEGEDVSFFAHDNSGRTWGLLVGRVKGDSASLDDFTVHGTKNPQNIEEKLLSAWLEELEGMGVMTVIASSPLDNVDLINRYLRLGFNPEEIIRVRKKQSPEDRLSAHQHASIRWNVPTTFENNSATFALERLALISFSTSIPSLELQELTESDLLLAQRAQAFVDRSASHLDPFIIEILPASTRTFIVKTKEQNVGRVVGLATARVNEYGVLEVPWFYVDTNAEGCASLLLAQALRKTALDEGVESALMVFPAASLSAWNAAAVAGFEVQATKAAGRLIELRFSTDTAPFKPLCGHFRELQELEYKLATLNARVSGQKSQVRALTTGEEFGAFADPALRRGKKRAEMRPPQVSVFDDLEIFSSLEKPKPLAEASHYVAWIVVSYAVALLVMLYLRRRDRRQSLVASGLHASEAWRKKNGGGDPHVKQLQGQWEWRPDPGKQDDEHSSDLDDFSLPLNSESTMHFSKSLP